jgi:hypothetical protein
MLGIHIIWEVSHGLQHFSEYHISLFQHLTQILCFNKKTPNKILLGTSLSTNKLTKRNPCRKTNTFIFYFPNTFTYEMFFKFRKTIVNPSMIRISVGGVFHVNVVHVQTYKELNSIFSTLKSKGFQVIVTSPTAPTRMSILHNEAQTKLKHNRNLIIFGAESTYK